MRIKKMRTDVDMSQGNILPLLLNFALPLMLGNLFQQMYNMVDTWVVGNFVNNEAFSAVGSVGPVINMLVGIFLGLSSGTGVSDGAALSAGAGETSPQAQSDRIKANCKRKHTVFFILFIPFAQILSYMLYGFK